MIDAAKLVGTVFSGLSVLVIEDVEDAGEAICAPPRTRGGGLPGVRDVDGLRARVPRTDGGRRAGRRVLARALPLLGNGRPHFSPASGAETTLQRWQQAHDLRAKGVGLLERLRSLGLFGYQGQLDLLVRHLR